MKSTTESFSIRNMDTCWYSKENYQKAPIIPKRLTKRTSFKILKSGRKILGDMN